MNYRHAFHAGNFADVMKHVLLTRILGYLRKKEAPFRAIDTHAGIGLYDLDAEEAGRTGEWRDGVGRLDVPFAPEVEGLLAPYRTVLAEVRARYGASAYPGSPVIVREVLRPQDRAVFVELHPEDAATLAERFRRTTNAKVVHLDGWVALKSLIPPKERRGLVLIDPPFEEPGELARMAEECLAALAKWPTGAYAAWYPIKDPAEIAAVMATLEERSPRPGLRLELMVRRPGDPTRLVGCGLFVFNPPWTLDADAQAILPALAERLSQDGYGAFRCEPFGPSA